MKNGFLLFLACTGFIASPLFAANKVSTGVTPFLGYRQDNLKWVTNSSSSFEWKSLKFLEYGVKAKTTIKDRYVIKYDLGLANLLNGSFKDNQYLRPGASSTSSSVKGWGMAVAPNFALGYKFKPKKFFDITPQVGYSYDLIYLNNNKNSGPFSSLKNTIQWYGPWTGFDAAVKIRRWSINLGAVYRLTSYRNTGNWKVQPVTTKNTLSQSGTGQGMAGRFSFGYEAVKSIVIGAETDMEWARVKSGHDTRTFANGVTTKSKLKKVNWNSYGAHLTLTKTY
mgnify:CR=1 FL=1